MLKSWTCHVSSKDKNKMATETLSWLMKVLLFLFSIIAPPPLPPIGTDHSRESPPPPSSLRGRCKTPTPTGTHKVGTFAKRRHTSCYYSKEGMVKIRNLWRQTGVEVDHGGRVSIAMLKFLRLGPEYDLFH